MLDTLYFRRKKIQIILSCASQGGGEFFFEIVVVRKENVIRIQDDSFYTCKLVLLLIRISLLAGLSLDHTSPKLYNSVQIWRYFRGGVSRGFWQINILVVSKRYWNPAHATVVEIRRWEKRLTFFRGISSHLTNHYHQEPSVCYDS